MSTQALVLNADYTPYAVVPWQRAWSLLDRGVAYLLSAYEGRSIRSLHSAWEWPAVLVLKKLTQRKMVKCSRENLFARDHYRCVYCGAQPRRVEGAPDLEALTFDHVIPRAQSRDGKTVVLADGQRVALTGWYNLVTACHACNRRKGARTPQQAGMRLPRAPRPPTPLESIGMHLIKVKIPKEWEAVLPEDSPWRQYWGVELT